MRDAPTPFTPGSKGLEKSLKTVEPNQVASLGWLHFCSISHIKFTADPGVASLIPARSQIFMEIDHEIIFMSILLPSADSRKVVVSYKRKYMHKVLVNRLVKLAQVKKCG